MKKAVWFTFLLTVIFLANAFAAEKVGMDAQREAHRMEMKKIKEDQRAAKKTETSASASSQANANGFWEKEGERSGLSRWAPKNWSLEQLNPVPFFQHQQDAYNARKAGGIK